MKSKYHNKKVEYDGITFDSKKEKNRYVVLKLLQQSGEISDLRLQVPFELIPAVYEKVEKQLKTKVKIVEKCVQRAVHYIADFVYIKDGEMIVEDTKGSSKILTPEFKLKMKLMRYKHGIQIKIHE